MEFKDLPVEIQLIAAETLKITLGQAGCNEKETAEELARVVRAAFLKLFSD
ncbi:hypothetical protein [Atlantibacter hermannii]|uniref:hypothetical protein n=1 Tax=Atlantibacter hermannii TaxID=565 RepID=UPI00289F8D20|nr:hypothetical protein [Atlantibacter hermannii]